MREKEGPRETNLSKGGTIFVNVEYRYPCGLWRIDYTKCYRHDTFVVSLSKKNLTR